MRLSNDLTAPSSPSLLLPANLLIFSARLDEAFSSWAAQPTLPNAKGASPQAQWLGEAKPGNSAPFPPWPPCDACRPSLSGAKFDIGLLRIQPWRALRATLIGPRLAQGRPRRGWLGCPPYPKAVEESVPHRVDAIAARWRSVAPRPLSSASPSPTPAGSGRRHRERFAARVPRSPASVRGVIRPA